jgi:hypothetical protein
MRFMMIVRPPTDAYDQPINPKRWPRWAATTTSSAAPASCSRSTASSRPPRALGFDAPAPSAPSSTAPSSRPTELIGGYWIIEVRSKEDALGWAQRIPLGTEVHLGRETEVELRRIAEPSDLA